MEVNGATSDILSGARQTVEEPQVASGGMKGMSKSRSEELDYRGLYNQLLQKHNLLKAQFEEVKAQNEEMKAQLKQNTATIADLMQKNHQREVAKISAAGAAPQNPVPALVSHKSSPIMKPAKPKIHSQLSTSSEALVQEMMQEMMGEISHNEDTTRRTLPVLKETGGNARTKLPALGPLKDEKGAAAANPPSSPPKEHDEKMKITSIGLPPTLIIVDKCAYQGCHRLTPSLTLPHTLRIIRMNAFEKCTGITSLTLPDKLARIEANAFARCTGLTGSLHLPHALVHLGSEAFSYCTKLTSLVIPKGFRYDHRTRNIGSRVFAYCSGLTSVVFEDPACSVSSLDPSGGKLKLEQFWQCTGLPAKFRPKPKPIVTKKKKTYDWDEDFEDWFNGG